MEVAINKQLSQPKTHFAENTFTRVRIEMSSNRPFFILR